jgi:hypothetical protein
MTPIQLPETMPKVMSAYIPERRLTFNQWATKVHRHVKKSKY